jgi:hypothetical protein
LKNVLEHLNARRLKNAKYSSFSAPHEPPHTPAQKAIDVAGIHEGLQSTAAYIAELSGGLAVMAGGARSANLAQLLAQAQLEAELCSRHSK